VSALDRASIDALDSGRMLANILGMAEQMGDALWRVESAAIEPIDTPGGLIVAGMGGSAIGGLLARAALADQASRPILCARGYGLPPWTTPDTTVLCASYSGNTGRRARRATDRRHDRRPPRRAGARRAGAGDPDPGRLRAARGDGLHAGQRARGRGAVRRGPEIVGRDRRHRRAPGGAGRALGS